MRRLASLAAAGLVAFAPVSAAGVDSQLSAIAKRCDLGPYEVKASSPRSAYITISPTIRARPLSRKQVRCVEAEVKKIGMTLQRSMPAKDD